MSEDDSAKLRMIAERGHYADRTVTYFRVFDPEAAARTGVELRHFGDLDTRLILYSGHIARDGTILLDVQPSPR